ncbi:MAG: sarcosine oxidase subunit alpha family protein [Gammaproteobacteria bacterium]|nr:sarcosine oxidase subunit alpha family protein [Gammaproteobacteria bacterium]
MRRLADGGLIDRNQPVEFTFDGKTVTGYKGDTIASALLANDIKLIGRSWKYHRPRGIIGDGAEEPNALFQVEEGAYTTPNVRGTQAEIYPGMVVNSTNAWPSVKFDLLSVFGLFARFLPAGFYYKTFMWPQKFWMFYEHMIRKASGLGESPRENDPEHYEKTNAHCDVLVVGAGATGLMAALAAGRAGARVILADEQGAFGGRLLSEAGIVDGQPAASWVEQMVSELQNMPEVRLLKRSTVFGYHDQNYLTIAERINDHQSIAERQGPREKVWRVRAKQVVLATGAHERPILFGHNDRPGVMLASAVSTYINRYGIKPANRAVLYTNNNAAYQAALDLDAAGVAVTIVDCRSDADSALVNSVKQRKIQILFNHVVAEAKGAPVSAAVVKQLVKPGVLAAGEKIINCDLIASSGGWNPAIHLLAQSGGKVRWDDAQHCFVPDLIVQQQRSAGAANGSFTLAACLADGLQAGAAAATAAGHTAVDLTVPATDQTESFVISELWRSPNGPKPWRGAKQFIDPQNDVSVADIFLAAREGFHSVEHVKRYTAMGFGTDQGKVGNIAGMAVLAEALGQPIASVGTTTFRPNYTPVTFGAIAGPEIGGTLFDPVRKTAMHGWHEEHGALFENVGQWHRPWYYPQGDESMDEAVNRECLATRNSVGMMDASTLGKIEIVGPDAAEFLNRIYTNAWTKLGIDCARYGFMLGEDGMVMDDGVTIRLDENRFFMHTTTGGAAPVLNWMERWLQTEWPELEVYMTSVTDHWATTAVVGPNSRKVVSAVVEGIDFDKDAFPFMTSRKGTIEGVPVRVNRISFSGELAYEVNVSAHSGRMVWERLYAAGEPYNITPYGTESMHVLRAEKGFVIVGQDTDGSVTPVDLGMNWIMSKTKDYLGRRSLERVDCTREGRKQLVGLLSSDPQVVLPEGGQIVNQASDQIPLPMHGHVTSSYYSACVGRSIAMALVKDGFQRQGETIYVATADGAMLPAEITKPVFYDPEGERQHG